MIGAIASVHVDELPSQSRSPIANAVADVAPPVYVYWYWAGSATTNSMSFHAGSVVNAPAEVFGHLSFEPPPLPPQQFLPVVAGVGFVGSSAPLFDVVKLDSAWNIVFRFLPILF